jgi:hypothetical protein
MGKFIEVEISVIELKNTLKLLINKPIIAKNKRFTISTLKPNLKVNIIRVIKNIEYIIARYTLSFLFTVTPLKNK